MRSGFGFVAALVALPALVEAAWADELPVLAATSDAFTFAVLGDTHYTPPRYPVTSFLHEIARELDAQPQPVVFVCHTGDVVEGGVYETREGKRKFVLAGYADMKAQLEYARRDLEQAFHRPVFIAVGNHDKHDPGNRAFRETMLPMMGRQLAHSLDKTWYAFRYGNTRLIFLDSGPSDYAEQTEFAQNALAGAQQDSRTQHVFVFNHFPLWPVVRAGFYNSRLTDALLPALLKYVPDAFFCGHTHNTLVCVRQFDGGSLVQIQGVSTGRGKTLLPMEQHNALLVPPAELLYGWGYREGSPTGYYLVHVAGPKVNVEWRIPGQGVIYAFGWQEPGRLLDVQRPLPPRKATLTDAMLHNAQAAELVVCPWTPGHTMVGVNVNGTQSASQELPPTYSAFWDEVRIPLAKEVLATLRQKNRISLENPGRAVFGIAAARLEVLLADGTRAVTPVASGFYFSARSTQAPQPSAAKAWQAVPPALTREVDLGQPLGPIDLSFAR